MKTTPEINTKVFYFNDDEILVKSGRVINNSTVENRVVLDSAPGIWMHISSIFLTEEEVLKYVKEKYDKLILVDEEEIEKAKIYLNNKIHEYIRDLRISNKVIELNINYELNLIKKEIKQ